ncbi:MAG: sulfatase [Flammeovirgaceae bacterium]|nr:sulfatase [Flammeovirgaceae bacterium]
MRINFHHNTIYFIFTILVLSSCKNELIPSGYKTKNIIVVVIDGPRYSETWGDPTHQYIPRLANQLLPVGNIYSNFYNNGPTYTNAGHTAITTGNYQEINNSGNELPQNPSIFQHWIQTFSKDTLAAWVIASKDKLEILSDCLDVEWNGKHGPSTNCGVNGNGTGYRNDSITYDTIIDILSTHHPQLVLINFREPDSSGHGNNWPGYTQGIQDTDQYAFQLWQFIENDSFYKGSTTLFVTNDHGRHLDGVADGFVSHGDSCDGCRHINLYAFGPDFKEGQIIDIPREQIDIPATIAELLNFKMPKGKGEIMQELFK